MHGAALTIQNCWREFILTRKSPYASHTKNNNNRSTSREPAGIPKLDLAQVRFKKEPESPNQEGIFHSEALIDLSSKRLQNLMLNSDPTSMLKVREEALNYKIKKETHKIQKLLSSQKISPRTGNSKQMELEKWVDQERKDIDKTREIYEENRKRTEEILKETMGIDRAFENLEMTHETLKKLFNEKVTTPREGLSFRSGFNSSRRLYELSQINKQINDEDNENTDNLKHLGSQSQNDYDNIVFSDQEEMKEPPSSLKQKIEMKLRGDHEITFGEKDKHD